MNQLDFYKEIDLLVSDGKLDEGLARVVAAMEERKDNPFYIAISSEFSNDKKEIANVYKEFIDEESKKMSLKALYSETTELSINGDFWCFSILSYDTFGSLSDCEWLGHPVNYLKDDVELTGMEALQKVYLEYQQNELYNDEAFEIMQSMSDLIVLLKFQMLIRDSLSILGKVPVPVIVTSHDSSIFYQYK